MGIAQNDPKTSDNLNDANLHQLSRETFYGFAALFNAYIGENQHQPLKVPYRERDCAVLEINLDGTMRVETATGEDVIPLQAEYVRPLFNQLAREFDLSIEGIWGETVKRMAAGEGS